MRLPAEEVVLHAGYSLDFVVKWRGQWVGVEVDGPSHFQGREPNSTIQATATAPSSRRAQDYIVMLLDAQADSRTH